MSVSFYLFKEYGIMILVLEGEFMEKHELSKLLEDFNRRINSLEVSLNVNKLKKSITTYYFYKVLKVFG